MVAFRKYLLLVLSCLTTVYALWPLPANYTHGSTVLWLSPHFEVLNMPLFPNSSPWGGTNAILAPEHFPEQASMLEACVEDLLGAAVERFREDLSHTYAPWKFYAKGASFEPEVLDHRLYITRITFKRDDPAVGPSSESYLLNISETGDILITVSDA